MFDLLRKKISGFAEKILGNTETNPANEPIVEPTPQPVESTPRTIESIPSPTIEEQPRVVEQSQPIVVEEKNQGKMDIPVVQSEKKIILPEIQEKEDRELKPRVGLTQKVSSFFTGTITLKQETVDSFLEEFEFSLLEADVELTTATALIGQLKPRLTNKTISSRENATDVILREIKSALREILPNAELNLDELITTHNPFVILILGPNGAGKTTSIAKLTHYLQKQNKKVVLASADTFRAGSIEQLKVHATKLCVRIIKHQYHADPAAVEFDDVKAAKAEHADVVIIDTAGRQDTNTNLLEELKKIQRVIQPHLKLYVGESYTGQAILQQASTFNEAIGIDGFILTKLDADTKGGGVLSILHNLRKPIAFFGTGQGYDDLTPFSLDAFLDRLIPNDA